jgi:hypothetical protein
MITIVNYYSSSQWPDMGGGAGGAGGDDSSNYQATIYTSMMAPPISVDSSESAACEAINTGYSTTVYISKDPANMGGTQIPEVGDTLYEVYPYSNSLSMGWVGFTDSMMMQKAIELNAGGQIISINDCSGGAGGGGADSVSLYSSGMAGLTPEADAASACATINVQYSNLAYIQKDASNMGGTAVPEVNDFLYEDVSAMTPLSDGYYGWDDMANAQSKAIYVSMGQISSITNCA